MFDNGEYCWAPLATIFPSVSTNIDTQGIDKASLSYRILPASRSMTFRSAFTASARSILGQVSRAVSIHLHIPHLIYDQQITASDSRTALPWYFVSASDINHIDDEICQLPTIIRSEIISSAFNQQQIRCKLAMQLLERKQVGRDVLTNSCMWAASGLNGCDPIMR